jgi:hypothetical protein
VAECEIDLRLGGRLYVVTVAIEATGKYAGTRWPMEGSFTCIEELRRGDHVSHPVGFKKVSTAGLESSPVAVALAGLRAHEARYFKNKYDHAFTTEPATEAKKAIDWVHRILKEERDIVVASRPLSTDRSRRRRRRS